jgi:hypothetical protein
VVAEDVPGELTAETVILVQVGALVRKDHVGREVVRPTGNRRCSPSATSRGSRTTHAPRALVHDEAFNVGSSTENYRIRALAEIVEDVVPGTCTSLADGGGPDKRSYRMDCSKIRRVLPEFETRWTMRRASRSCTTPR